MQVDKMRLTAFAGSFVLFGAFAPPISAQVNTDTRPAAGTEQSSIVVAQAGEKRGGGGGAGAPAGGGGGRAMGTPGGGGGRAIGSRGEGGRGVMRAQGRQVTPSVGETARRSGDGVRSGASNRGDRVLRGDRRGRPNVGVVVRGGGDQPWRAGRRYNWGGPQFYFWNGYYYGDCQWLQRKARVTGSRYWLQRYRLCRAGF